MSEKNGWRVEKTAEKLTKKERHEYVKRNAPWLVEDLKYSLGPQLANHKQLFLESADGVFQKW